jgi:hypothetical protein
MVFNVANPKPKERTESFVVEQPDEETNIVKQFIEEGE